MKLLESIGFDIVMTVINLVSKTAYFIFTHIIVNTEKAAIIFLYYCHILI